MLQFLYPLGLLAAAGMIIPVIIHLWNIKNGKTLKIGSIALLGIPANQRSSNFRITDWPLLILRCLLLLWIAFLLAEPLFKSKLATADQPGWVLLEKEHFPLLWKDHKKMLDSLVQKGYVIRDFNVGFQPLDVKDTATVFSKTANSPLSYFSLISQLNTLLTPGTKVYLFTTNLLSRFTGEQPKVDLDLQWKVFTLNKNRVSWPFSAYPVSRTAIRQQIAYSSPEGTFYRNNILKETSALQLDTAQLDVLIYGKEQADVRYVKAAVQAIAEFTQRPIRVQKIQSLAQVNRKSQVFWLSDQQVNVNQLKKLPLGTSFFKYAAGKKEKVKTVIRDQEGVVLQDALLLQRIRYTGKTNQAVWTDGYGIPLLTRDTLGGLNHYDFYSRFNQNWTDLVWTNGFVRALVPLILPQEGFLEAQQSQRILTDLPQLSNPHSGKADAVTTANTVYANHSLTTVFWWLLLLTFFIERILTYKRVEGKI